MPNVVLQTRNEPPSCKVTSTPVRDMQRHQVNLLDFAIYYSQEHVAHFGGLGPSYVTSLAYKGGNASADFISSPTTEVNGRWSVLCVGKRYRRELPSCNMCTRGTMDVGLAPNAALSSNAK